MSLNATLTSRLARFDRIKGISNVDYLCITIRYSNDISFSNLQGAQWGLLAALFFSFNDLLGKQSTRLDADMFATLTLMFGFGSFLFAVS